MVLELINTVTLKNRKEGMVTQKMKEKIMETSTNISESDGNYAL
jgi:hypothetical protein